MAELRQYEQVHIRHLTRAPEAYDGWGVNRRAPRVGEYGTLVDVLRTPGAPDSYVVESSAPDGTTLWLGDFTADELEPAPEGADPTP